eukprot:TRINITY_DN3629_c0_g1_i1.p1 TRINITY_DN3629_c0_g1~~TRINITY_DN3629_c0_g1_i1.p1  ORF type:complete len:270 (+),score=41.98 TRINITY_DN3629_c0_g1_i1:347-1156(+)
MELLLNQLPDEFLTFMKFHDGQILTRKFGFFGWFQFYHYQADIQFLTFKKALEIHWKLKSHGFLFPFAVSISSCQSFFFLNERGQVVKPYSSFDDVCQVRNGESFMGFMESYMKDLKIGTHDLISGQISRFSNNDAMGSTTITNGIKIQISVLFVPELSDVRGKLYIFTYRLKISCVDDSLRKCRLTTRTWRVYDEHGPHSPVHGPGVIGEYPEMYPGCDVFEYQSCSRLGTQLVLWKVLYNLNYVSEPTDEFSCEIDEFRFDVRTSCV